MNARRTALPAEQPEQHMRSFILTFFAGLFLTTASAQAQLHYKTGTTKTGIRYIGVAGKFDYNQSLAPFNQLILRHKPQLIVFQSKGGNPHKAMEMGVIIRRHGLTTLQDRTSVCTSACALAFMGGANRIAAGGSIGVHQSSLSPSLAISRNEAVSSIQDTTATMLAYLSKMGVDPAILSLALSTDSHRMRYLTTAEMTHFKVTTEAVGTETPTIQSAGRTEQPRAELGYAPRQAQGIQPFGRARPPMLGGSFHIQIKSFKTRQEASTFARSFRIPSVVHPANNGWFAVTLQQTHSKSEAQELTKLLKRDGAIPQDSLVTKGENFIR